MYRQDLARASWVGSISTISPGWVSLYYTDPEKTSQKGRGRDLDVLLTVTLSGAWKSVSRDEV